VKKSFSLTPRGARDASSGASAENSKELSDDCVDGSLSSLSRPNTLDDDDENQSERALREICKSTTTEKERKKRGKGSGRDSNKGEERERTGFYKAPDDTGRRHRQARKEGERVDGGDSLGERGRGVRWGGNRFWRTRRRRGDLPDVTLGAGGVDDLEETGDVGTGAMKREKVST
jgi:hypothetical protein